MAQPARAALPHRCHAVDCETRVRPELLMCPRHWFQVPLRLRTPVWRAFRAGQTEDRKPSLEWCRAADAAVAHVAELEGRTVAITFTQAFHPGA